MHFFCHIDAHSILQILISHMTACAAHATWAAPSSAYEFLHPVQEGWLPSIPHPDMGQLVKGTLHMAAYDMALAFLVWSSSARAGNPWCKKRRRWKACRPLFLAIRTFLITPRQWNQYRSRSRTVLPKPFLLPLPQHSRAATAALFRREPLLLKPVDKSSSIAAASP